MPGPADFTTILQTLRSHDVEFVVVGGVSAVINGAPVSTFDLDIVHKRTTDNIDRLLAALGILHAIYRGRPGPSIEPGRDQLMSPCHQLLQTDAGPLDVLGALGTVTYDDLLGDTTEFALENTGTIRVLNLERLLALKEQLGREKDRAVIPVLRRTIEERNRRD